MDDSASTSKLNLSRFGGLQRLTDQRIGWALFAVFAIVALALMGHRSLWLDEFYTLDYAAPGLPYLTAFKEHIATDPSLPPVYYSLQHFWLQIFGVSEAGLRSLNVLGIAALGITMLYSRRLPWFAAAWLPFWILLLTSRFAWDFVWEGRTYFLLLSGATLLSFLAIDVLWRLERTEKVGAALLAATGLTAFLLGTLHYFGLLFAGSVCLVLLAMGVLKREWRLAATTVIAGSALLMADGLWIAQGAHHAFGHSFWIKFAPLDTIASFVIYSFSNDVIVAGLVGVAAYGGWRVLKADRPLLLLLAAGGITFAAAFFISWLKMPLFHYRYLIVLVPVFLLIAARLLAAAPRSILLPAVVLCSLVLSLPFAIWKSLPGWQDFRTAGAYVNSHFSGQCQGATVILPWPYEKFMAGYYSAEGKSWQALPFEQASVEAVKDSPCPVLGWIGDQFNHAAADVNALDWADRPIDIVQFRGVILVVRK